MVFKKIKDFKKVINFLGSWPSFHDAEVLNVELDAKMPAIIMRIYVFETDKTLDEKGYYKRIKNCIITLKFSSIQDLELYDFNYQNILFNLEFRDIKEKIKVLITSSYGLNGKFVCEKIEIISVEGCREQPQRAL